ncbi:hypothetical protein [Streptomyces sp. NPDC056056]|uniref:hypothetical protein n=1 Tax=Streptomyces sp. NPDC056056 TaxID=3345698 RepID=UPI0035D615B8
MEDAARSEGPSGSLEDARRLLESEADRRGISVRNLIDRLAREGRRTGRPVSAAPDDPAHWLTAPPWARSASVVFRHSSPKTAAVEGAEVFDDDALVFGAMRSGKTSSVDLARAQLEMRGIPFVETVRTTEFGSCFVELSWQRPDGNKE